APLTTWREAQDLLRGTREEATRLVEEAQRESDTVRERARSMLNAARSEVAALNRRRQEIVEELGELSGVISALAVPTSARETNDSDVSSAEEDVPR
ncbi:MAG: hypothetical protein ABJA81_10445, partial [Nocardioidaceae bacterium]